MLEKKSIFVVGSSCLVLAILAWALGWNTGRTKFSTRLEKIGSFYAVTNDVVIEEDFRIVDGFTTRELGLSIEDTSNKRPWDRSTTTSNAQQMRFTLEFFVKGSPQPFFRTEVRLSEDGYYYHPAWHPDYGILVKNVALFPGPPEYAGASRGEFLSHTNAFPFDAGRLLPNQEYRVRLRVTHAVAFTNRFHLWVFHYNKLSPIDLGLYDFIHPPKMPSKN